MKLEVGVLFSVHIVNDVIRRKMRRHFAKMRPDNKCAVGDWRRSHISH